MSLFQKLKENQLQARKYAMKEKTEPSQIVSKLLTTLMGEAMVDGKEPSDDHLIAVIRKFVKNTKQVLEIVPNDDPAHGAAFVELKVLLSYLPRVVTEDEIKQIKSANPDANKGQLMKLVKEFCQEKGILFDGKIVNSLI